MHSVVLSSQGLIYPLFHWYTVEFHKYRGLTVAGGLTGRKKDYHVVSFGCD